MARASGVISRLSGMRMQKFQSRPASFSLALNHLAALARRLPLAAFLAIAALFPIHGGTLTGALAAGPATSTAPLPAAKVLDAIQTNLEAIEKSLEQQKLSDADLQNLRGQLDPLSVRARDAVEALLPRLASIKVRLDQLGPKPEERAADGETPPESPSVTAERADQQKAYNEIDQNLKRARLISVQADQIAASITTRRRALFAKSLFERATSIASPSLWFEVSAEVPQYAEAVQASFALWFNDVNAKLDGWSKPSFWAGLILVALLYLPLALAARHVLARGDTVADQTRLQKILGAWWVALTIAVPPIVIMAVIAGVGLWLGLDGGILGPVIQAAAIGVVRIVAAFGIARGLFAPTRPGWRIVHRSDAVSETVIRMAVSVASIVSVTRVFEALNEVVGASLQFSVATRGLGAFVAGMALIVGLWRLGGRVKEDDCFGPQVSTERDWFLLLRIAAWPAALAVIVAVLVGFPSFASFLIDQVVWFSAVFCLLFMSSMLIEEAIAALSDPSSRAGTRLTAAIGIGRNAFDLIGVVVSGVVRLSLFALAAALIVAPWGVRSSDFSFDFRAAFFGFRVGDVTISPASIIIAIIFFGFASAVSHSLVQWVDTRLLPLTKLDAGLRNSIKTSLGYVGFILAAGLALAYLGVSVEKLALVAGALSVGIGFGLQSIVNNFVSGLILLWERAVRVGDWIIVGDDQGFVRRINVRSTEIETFDRSQVIVPNSNLITGVVKNLVRTDRTGRLIIPIIVSGNADPEKVREVLFATAKAHDFVLKIPAPQILFTGMSPTALTFDLLVFLSDVETILRVRSDLHFEIHKRLNAANLATGPSATKIELVGINALGVKPSSESSLGQVAQKSN
jgi:small-conductance mechanosensitive channel